VAVWMRLGAGAAEGRGDGAAETHGDEFQAGWYKHGQGMTVRLDSAMCPHPNSGQAPPAAASGGASRSDVAAGHRGARVVRPPGRGAPGASCDLCDLIVTQLFIMSRGPLCAPS
jgi:hypothetical protein